MNQTVTANISGIVFHIELDAYEKLNKYLNTIRNYFRDADGTDEIMADIEARIAELFKADMQPGKDVITLQNVQKVIEVMGEPEQYIDDEEQEHYSSHTNESKTNFKSKKLYRDSDDSMIGGVCSGLSYYFGIDKIWFRAAFLIALIAGVGTGIIIYLILWIIVPAPKTTAEKLEMKGEPINVENIGNTIKDEFHSFKKKVSERDTKGYTKKAESSIYKFFDFLTKVLYYFFKFILKLIGIALVFASIMTIIALITFTFGGPIEVNIFNANLNGNWASNLSAIYFSSSLMSYLGIIGLLLVTLIPLMGLFYGGLKLLFKIPSSNKAISISAASLWVLGVIMIVTAGVSLVRDHSTKQNLTEYIALERISSDTLILNSSENTYGTSYFGLKEIYIDDDKILMTGLNVDVISSNTTDETIKLKLLKSARGANRKEAGKRAENIQLKYEIEKNNLQIKPMISIPFEEHFRDQNIKISIVLPIGKSIFLAPSSRDLIYDIENVTNTYDGKMIGHHWKMTEKGLACTDCEWIKEELVEEIIIEKTNEDDDNTP